MPLSFWEALMYQKMTEELLIKFLNNCLTDEELDEIIRWVGTDALNKDSKSLGLRYWKSFQVDENVTDKVKFNFLLDKIHHKINIDKSKITISDSKTSVLFAITTWLTRVAAILLLPVIAFLCYTIYEKSFDSAIYANMAVDSVEIIAPIGSRTVVQLSDGLWMNIEIQSE